VNTKILWFPFTTWWRVPQTMTERKQQAWGTPTKESANGTK
jgi:hypothetical protein